MKNLKMVKIEHSKSSHLYVDVSPEDLKKICKDHGLRFKSFEETLKVNPDIHTLIFDMENLDPSWRKRKWLEEETRSKNGVTSSPTKTYTPPRI